MASYIVVGTRPWNKTTFDTHLKIMPGEWHYISLPNELTLEKLDEIKPRYIFFLHWSIKVPEEIIEKYECVCFHPSHLPYGRGGSPIQNLILAGFEETKLTAFRMTNGLDDGPIYMQSTLSLAGSAQEIFEREMRVAVPIIRHIIEFNPKPLPQFGEPTYFKRRAPHESRITGEMTSKQFYDFVRMLDAEGYPHAFVEHDGLRTEFFNAVLIENMVISEAKTIEYD